jgi:hypothetical protein
MEINMEDDKLKHYIYDLGIFIKEKARQAKIEKNAAIGSPNSDYAIGYLMAMHEIISLMKQQAEVFVIKQDEIGLADIDPDSELL